MQPFMTRIESSRGPRHQTELVEMWRDLLASRRLAGRIMVRDLRAQYRQSLLGFLWAVIPPVVTALGFTLAKNVDVIRVGDTQLPYPAYVMFSMTLWQTFTEALNAPQAAWNQAKPMLTRIRFPREAILVAKLGEVLFNFGVKLILIVGIFVFFDMPVTAKALLAPLALAPLILLGIGLGTFLVCIGGLYQDVSKGMPFLTLVWLMITPVVYPPPAAGAFATLVRLNPVTPLLVTVRELATTGVVSDPAGFWQATAVTAACLVSSWIMFRVATPFVIERISA